MPRDFLDRTRSIAEKMTGNSVEECDAELSSRFALYGPRKRAEILESIDAGMTGELDEEDIRNALSKAELRRELGETHAKLRKMGR
jgi:hypothetical protein